jgi:hypothetical protein
VAIKAELEHEKYGAIDMDNPDLLMAMGDTRR